MTNTTSLRIAYNTDMGWNVPLGGVNRDWFSFIRNADYSAYDLAYYRFDMDRVVGIFGDDVVSALNRHLPNIREVIATNVKYGSVDVESVINPHEDIQTMLAVWSIRYELPIEAV